MPKTKRTASQNAGRRNNGKTFNPEIKRGLGVILLLLLAGILILSYFGLAGEAGAWLDRSLSVLFGRTRLLAPLLLIMVGILIELQREYPHDSRHFLGFLFFLLGFNGLIHLFLPPDQMVKIAIFGEGGGVFGLALSYPLKTLFGFWASLVILAGVLLSSLLLLFNTSLARLLAGQTKFLLKLGTFGRIVVGVISLFVKKTPPVLNYETGGDSFEPAYFETRAVKQKSSEEISPKEKTPAEPDKNAPADILETPSYQKTYTRGLPPLNLLSATRSQPLAGDIKANSYTIKKTLENFGIPVEMGEIRVGPTVTQYSLKPADGVKLSRITALHNDLALSLASHPIRIEAPIPGKALVGIEVPNQKTAIVPLREIMESKEWRERKPDLSLALGKDVSGKPWTAHLSSLPHLLVAGATGSGKTVCLNALIISLLYQHTPETLRFILVDPKRVELPLYNGIPHLLTPVITDIQKTVNALKWTIGEMERRFEILAKTAKRDILSHNRVYEEKIPYVVFIIDELADLMVTAGAEVEAGIIRLAQMARAVGIHLILATQRPSVEIITGLIKANIPARIAFSVASLIDSRTILDASGAEKLLGRGDMLWSPPDMAKPKRLQGAYIGDEEIKRVVDFLKGDEPPMYNDEIVAKQQTGFSFIEGSAFSEDGDPLLTEAKEVIVQAGKASASLLQRRLKVGYARAARLLDLLEEMGIIGPGDGAKPREILIPIATAIQKPDNDLETETNEKTSDDKWGSL